MTAVIQSIQRVSITIGSGATSNTATINSVNSANAMLIFNGVSTNENTINGYSDVGTRIALTNATTVTATRGLTTNSITVNCTVIEFSSGVNSIQAGTITIATNTTSNTATISAVGANAFVIWLGCTDTSLNHQASRIATTVQLTNSTTVTATIGVASGVAATVTGFMVVDLSSTIINSIQAMAHTDATSATSYTDTITSVTPGNTLLIYGGERTGTGTDDVDTLAHTLVLTNATTVTITRAGTGTSPRTVCYTVVQFQAAILNRSVQRGTIALSSQTSGAVTISGVNILLSFANWANFLSVSGNANVSNPTLTLTNGTTVTAAVASAGSPTISYEIIEFVAPVSPTSNPQSMTLLAVS